MKLLPLAALLLAAPVSAADLLVDAFGGGDFTTIQAAVDAAVDGDRILVSMGSYPGFSIDNKALSVFQAQDGDAVVVQGTIRVDNLEPGKLVCLSRLLATGSGGFGGLVLLSNSGSVRVQECTFQGSAGAGVTITFSQDVELSQTTILGGAASAGIDGQPGLFSVASRVVLSGGQVFGGAGGDSDPAAACAGGAGGAALFSGFGSEAFARGCELNGGDGGAATSPACTPGEQGPATVAGGGTVYEVGCSLDGPSVGGLDSFPGPARLFRTGIDLTGPMLAEVQGAPGDTVLLLAGLHSDFRILPFVGGVLVVRQPLVSQVLGVLDASGQGSFPYSLTTAGAAPVLLQTLHFPAGPRSRQLGNGRVLVR